jgi:hypothetical protein
MWPLGEQESHLLTVSSEAINTQTALGSVAGNRRIYSPPLYAGSSSRNLKSASYATSCTPIVTLFLALSVSAYTEL